jgi:lipoate-protein ligase A
MVHCATEKKTGLVIVSRDSDYGVTLDQKSYINDHLRQEFSDRVSQKRQLLLCSRLSDALKLFEVRVSQQEEEAEKELVSNVASRSTTLTTATDFDVAELLKAINQAFANSNQQIQTSLTEESVASSKTPKSPT